MNIVVDTIEPLFFIYFVATDTVYLSLLVSVMRDWLLRHH